MPHSRKGVGFFIERNRKGNTMATKDTIKINGKEYNVADLSKEVKAQLTNLRVCDAELQRLKAQIAITQTAKSAYSRALEAALPKVAN